VGYALHIERPGQIIENAEWVSAIESTEGVRLASGDHVMVNPDTGEEIRIRGRVGDAEVEMADGEWERAFGWFEGRAAFRYTEDLSDPGHPVRKRAAALAASLGAAIVGDEGEEYDW
jgi:hypothetical protein